MFSGSECENEMLLVLLLSSPSGICSWEWNWLYFDRKVILKAQCGEWETLSKSVSAHRNLQSKAEVDKHQLPRLAPWPCWFLKLTLLAVYAHCILILVAKAYSFNCKEFSKGRPGWSLKCSFQWVHGRLGEITNGPFWGVQFEWKSEIKKEATEEVFGKEQLSAASQFQDHRELNVDKAHLLSFWHSEIPSGAFIAKGKAREKALYS